MSTVAFIRQKRVFFHGFRLSAIVLLIILAKLLPTNAQQVNPTFNAEATNQLFSGVFANDLNAVKMAIAGGADLMNHNDWGLTAIDLAVDKGYYKIAHYLLDIRNVRQQKTGRTSETRPLSLPLSTGQRLEAPLETEHPKPVPVLGVLSGLLPGTEMTPKEGKKAGLALPLKGPNPFHSGTKIQGTPTIVGEIQEPVQLPGSKQTMLPSDQLAVQPSVIMPIPPSAPKAFSKEKASVTSTVAIPPPVIVIELEAASIPQIKPPELKAAGELLGPPTAPPPSEKMTSTEDTGAAMARPMVIESAQLPASPSLLTPQPKASPVVTAAPSTLPAERENKSMTAGAAKSSSDSKSGSLRQIIQFFRGGIHHLYNEDATDSPAGSLERNVKKVQQDETNQSESREPPSAKQLRLGFFGRLANSFD